MKQISDQLLVLLDNASKRVIRDNSFLDDNQVNNVDILTELRDTFITNSEYDLTNIRIELLKSGLL